MRTLCFFLIGSALTAATPASASITRMIGGKGGGASTLACPPGQMLVGVRVRTGDWVDGLSALCAPPSGDPRSEQGYAGGQGGEAQEYYCPAGSWIDRLRAVPVPLEQFKVISSIGFHCANTGVERCLHSRGGKDCDTAITSKGFDTFTHKAQTIECPEGEGAIGLNARSGTALDAIGLICGPATASRVALGQAPIGRVGTPTPRATPLAPATSLGTSAQGAPCRQGLVWREASPADFVCVSPAARDRVAEENRLAGDRVDPAAAPNCRIGYVWREAFANDLVCVPPQSRDLARWENEAAR